MGLSLEVCGRICPEKAPDLGRGQMMRPCPDITHVLAVARRRMRIGHEPGRRGPQRRLLPPMRFGMAVGEGEHSGFPIVKSTRSREETLRVGDGDFKRGVTNAERLRVDEHKEIDGLPNSEARL